MLREEECRTKAQECEEMAARIRDPDLRQLWEEMATKWRHLAKQVQASSR